MKKVLILSSTLVIYCSLLSSCTPTRQTGGEANLQHQDAVLQSPPTASVPDYVKPEEVVALIDGIAITEHDLQMRILMALRNNVSEFEPQEMAPVDAGEVLRDMIAEKAMALEAMKKGKLNNKRIKRLIENHKNRKMIEGFTANYLENEVAVSQEEIDAIIEENPNVSPAIAENVVKRRKARDEIQKLTDRLIDELNVEIVEENLETAAEAYGRLLHHPKKDYERKWVRLEQIREELTDEEKQVVLAKFEGGQVTVEDWFYAISDFAPPSRPRYLVTAQGAERFLKENVLTKQLILAMAKKQNLDETEEFIAELEQYKQNLLVGEYQSAKFSKIDPDPSEEEIKAYYEANRNKIFSPRWLTMDVIWFEDRETAKLAKKMIEQGADFKELQQQYSPSPNQDPDIVYPNQEGAFFEQIWLAEEGDVIGPLKGLQAGDLKWRLIWIVKKYPGQLLEYSKNATNTIKYTMFGEQRQEILEKARKDLLEKYDYTIYPANVEDAMPIKDPAYLVYNAE